MTMNSSRATRRPFEENQELTKSPTSKRDPLFGIRRTESSSVAASKLLSPQLRAIATSKIPVSAYYANENLESVFVEELLSHQNDILESRARKELKNFTNLPGSTVHPHAENKMLLLRRRQRATPSTNATGDTFGSNCSGGNVPVRHHTKCLNNEPLTSRNSAKSIKDGGSKWFAPYVEVNSKISRVLQHTNPRETSKMMRAPKLDKYYRLVTRETSAAIILQSEFRRVLAAERCKRLAFRWKQATMIQCLVRSHFARMRLLRLVEKNEWANGMRNQFVRVYIARYQRRKRIEREYHAAIVCQCAIRANFAKKRTKQLRLQLSWVVNQRRWRTISIRLAWADNRVHFYARIIQCVVRRELARRRVRSLHVLYSRSSTCIQACWRRYIVRKQWSNMMYHLNVDARCNRIRIITSEHRYWRDKVEELESKLHQKRTFEDQRVNLEKERSNLHDQIRAFELHYRDQTRLLDQTTPQTIAGGLAEQIRVNLRDVRERITKAKLELFFDVERKLQLVLKEIEFIQGREDEARCRTEHWGTWLDDEMEELWKFQRLHDREVEEEEKRRSINHEWMMWAVKFRLPCGKPDRRRLFNTQFREPDCGRCSSERLRQLIDCSKLKAGDTLAANHMMNTFQPFQNMWDRFNSLNANAFAVKQVLDETLIPPLSVPGSESTSVTPPIKKNAKRVTPNKLPWDLLIKVREEKERIEEVLGTRH